MFLKNRWTNAGISLFPVAVTAGLLFAAVRAIGMIGQQQYRFVLPLGFVLMMLMPFIFLNRDGRKKTGFVKSNARVYYLYAVGAGALMALICYAAGLLLFGLTSDNWYVSIKNSYHNSMDVSAIALSTQFIIFTIPAILFSPAGEEIFFRGFLQLGLSQLYSYRRAMIIDSLFFALVHLFHHGFVKDSSGVIHFYPLSGFLWVVLMFCTALVFAWLKRSSDSIYPAIVAHAVFNVTMNITIFYGM